MAMMIQDQYNIDEEIAFVERNIDRLDELAVGQPTRYGQKKSEREFWKKGQFKKDVLEGLKWWKTLTYDQKMRLNGVKGFAQQAMDLEFYPQRLQWIYSLTTVRFDPGQEAKERAHKVDMKTLRDKEQPIADRDKFDMGLHCWGCGKFLFEYDERNNRRHEKDELCTCSSSTVTQNEQKTRVSVYRKSLDERKKREKAKEARRRKR